MNQSIDSERRQEREHRGRGGEQRGDLGLLLLEEEPGVEVLVDLLQVGGGARVEVFAAGQVGDRLQRLLVEAHAHRPAFGADDLAARRADADRVDAHAAVGGHARRLDRIGAGRRLAVGEQDDRGADV